MVEFEERMPRWARAFVAIVWMAVGCSVTIWVLWLLGFRLVTG